LVGVTAWDTPPNWSPVRVFTSNEHDDAGRIVSRGHVQLAVSAPPIARQHVQPKRRQMVNGQLLTERADLGTGQHRHAATMLADTDDRSSAIASYPQSRIHPQPAQARM
jgi:hypothetical protein